MLFNNTFVRKLVSQYFRNIRYSASAYYSQNETSKKDLKSLLENSSSFEEKDPSSDQWLTTPYPVNRRSQRSLQPNVAPETTSVILFPGQVTI